jgi:hypothetical protein
VCNSFTREITLKHISHLYPRSDDPTDPATSLEENRKFIPLRIALQRANEVYKKDNFIKLSEKISSKELTIFARRSEKYISSECYEFNKSNPPIFHKDEFYKEREIIAYKLAFDLRNEKNVAHAAYEGIDHIFSFLDLECDIALDNSKFPLYPTEKIVDLIINEDRSNIFFSTILFNSEKTIRESKYWRDITYRKYKLYDVSFDQSEMDIHFPYSQPYASRQRRGRAETYSQLELAAALDKLFPDVTVHLEIRQVMKAAGDFYADKGSGVPVEKTLRRKSERWLTSRKKVSGHK